VARVLDEEGFTIVNDIAWYKRNAPPALLCHNFTASHETLLWAKPGEKHKFNYEVMKEWDVSNDLIARGGKQMRSVWDIPVTSQNEKGYGHHPTQKPEELLDRIICACTDPGDWILDPFLGSGTTMVVAKRRGRNCVGIELEEEYIKIARERVDGTSFEGEIDPNGGLGEWI